MDPKAIVRLFDQLGVLKLDGNGGPYSREEVGRAEAELGVPFDLTLVQVLTTLGGLLTFDVGSVEVSSRDGYLLNRLFGLGGDSLDIRRRAKGYAGQVPSRWVPVGDDEQGHFYCIDPRGKVYHVRLEDRLWSRPECPEVPPPNSTLIANSFEEFLALLQLPVWARDN